MAFDLMIIKKRGRKITLKITQKMRAGYAPDSHTIEINLKDFRDVAGMLHDLNDLYDVPVAKAIEEYKKLRTGLWPFS